MCATWTDVRRRNFVNKIWLLCICATAHFGRWIVDAHRNLWNPKRPNLYAVFRMVQHSYAHSGINCVASMQCIKVLKCGHRAQHFADTRHAKPQSLFGCVAARPHRPTAAQLSNFDALTALLVVRFTLGLRSCNYTLLNPSSCVYAIMLYAWNATPHRLPIREHRDRKITLIFHIERQAAVVKVQQHFMDPSICNTGF